MSGEKTLPAYIANHTCPKCGNGSNFTVWWREAYRFREKRDGPTQEHIAIHCQRCHYAWYEATLDSAPATSEEER